MKVVPFKLFFTAFNNKKVPGPSAFKEYLIEECKRFLPSGRNHAENTSSPTPARLDSPA